MMAPNDAASRRAASTNPPSGLAANATRDISAALTALLADVFALYIKTKNFHWHISGPHFRDYHLLLDEQGDQLFGITDDIAERVRKIGGTTLRSVGQIGRLKRILDNDAEYVTPEDMLAELRDDNKQLTQTCVKSTTSVTSTAMSRQRACLRTGSTRPNGAYGSCSRPAGKDSQAMGPGDGTRRSVSVGRRASGGGARPVSMPCYSMMIPSLMKPIGYS